MENIHFKKGTNINREELKGLYKDAGWYAYTNDIECLVKALKGSLKVITAWENDKLVGLIRVVGDGHTILYIQDILVLKDYKRMGIGTELVKRILDEYKYVRQKVLLTDDTYETKSFYKSLGFEPCNSKGLISFIKIS